MVDTYYGDANSSILRMTIVGLSPYSARGLQQTLTPITQSKSLKRTINGELLDLSVEQFRKYGSVVTGNDQRCPALDGIFAGVEVKVECIAELSYVTAVGSPGRPVVTGTSRTEGIYTFYRPLLTMIVTDIDQQFDEYNAQVSWTLTLEEK